MKKLTLLLLVACSRSQPAPFEEGFDALDRAICQHDAECGRISRSRVEACVVDRAAQHQDEPPPNSAGIQGCLAAWDFGHCDARLPLACAHLYQASGDCAVSCPIDEVCEQGSCRSPGPAGAACVDGLFSFDCQAPFQCELGVCVPLPPAGVPCYHQEKDGVALTACAVGTWCDENDLCRAQRPLGAACSQFGSCVPGAACVDGTCQGWKDVGDPCDPFSPVETGCPADRSCLKDDACH
jgi:hypothetical protein